MDRLTIIKCVEGGFVVHGAVNETGAVTMHYAGSLSDCLIYLGTRLAPELTRQVEIAPPAEPPAPRPPRAKRAAKAKAD